MAQFSAKSIERLRTCDERLQRVFAEVIKHRDCVVLCGHRPKAEQDQAVKDGLSKTPWPTSKHNSLPSRAVDAMPCIDGKPADWKDWGAFAHFAGFVQGIAEGYGIGLRWGGDWGGNGTSTDDKFLDGPHFELIDP